MNRAFSLSQKSAASVQTLLHHQQRQHGFSAGHQLAVHADERLYFEIEILCRPVNIYGGKKNFILFFYISAALAAFRTSKSKFRILGYKILIQLRFFIVSFDRHMVESLLSS